MPRVKNWDLLKCTKTKEEFDEFFSSLPKHKIKSTHSSQSCFAGKKCCGKHTMTMRYWSCNANKCDESRKCSVEYKTIECGREMFMCQISKTRHVSSLRGRCCY